jgi:hypothetical protein
MSRERAVADSLLRKLERGSKSHVDWLHIAIYSSHIRTLVWIEFARCEVRAGRACRLYEAWVTWLRSWVPCASGSARIPQIGRFSASVPKYSHNPLPESSASPTTTSSSSRRFYWIPRGIQTHRAHHDRSTHPHTPMERTSSKTDATKK